LNAVVRDSNYNLYHDSAPDAGSSNTSATWGTIDENADRLVHRGHPDVAIGDNNLRYNVGVRYVQTDQIVGLARVRTDPRNRRQRRLPVPTRPMAVCSRTSSRTKNRRLTTTRCCRPPMPRCTSARTRSCVLVFRRP
jgi:hypothetical protein